LSRGPAGKQRVVLVAIVLAVVVLCVAFPTVRVLHKRHLHTLFSGPFEEKSETRSGFYALPDYDLRSYLPDRADGGPAVEPVFLDKLTEDKGWEREIERMHPDFKLDVSTGATRVARLRSPSVYRERWVPRGLTITYPPEGAVFPPNLCSPWVEWSDVHNDLWQLTVSVPEGSLEWRGLSTTRRLRIPDAVWRQVKEQAANGRAFVEVKGIQCSGLWGKRRETVHGSSPVGFRISKDPADNAVVYRLVDPPFVNKKTPDMFVRDIRRKRAKLFLSARQQYCLNCHTFSSKTGREGRMSLQVRYAGERPVGRRVYVAVYDVEKGRGRRTILPFREQMSTFTAWSPDETKLAISAQQGFAGLPPVTLETQSLSQYTSDVAVYDVPAGTACLLPGASDPKLIEIYPSWTPDGESIVYASADAKRHPAETQLNLHIISYNEGRGGISRPLAGAAQNGKSNYYPRFSPDGKWMTFVQSRYGSLVKASSACNVPHAADSWHSWSSNSRWMVFATKRDDGIYARLYMTHIDEGGRASPAVRLPLEDPRMLMSFNIPEFVADVPPINERRLFEDICIDADVLKVKPMGAGANEPESR